MGERRETPKPRAQVYFEKPKVWAALQREARAAHLPISRAAERAIERGLQKRPSADPEDRVLNLDRALRDHMRAQQRDMGIVLELIVEFARAFFARLPDTPADEDPLLRASVEARIERMLDEAAYRLAGGARRLAEPAAEPSAMTPGEPRSFRAPD